MVFILALTWLGWQHLRSVVPWPVLIVATVTLVFLACVGLSAVLARTPLAKALTGRSPVPWPAWLRRDARPVPAPDTTGGWTRVGTDDRPTYQEEGTAATIDRAMAS